MHTRAAGSIYFSARSSIPMKQLLVHGFVMAAVLAVIAASTPTPASDDGDTYRDVGRQVLIPIAAFVYVQQPERARWNFSLHRDPDCRAGARDAARGRWPRSSSRSAS